ncbi:MAG: AI-2E family transporter [Caulobacteraceae bacterium]|nr:AI-2E family transporter [Caulobacteraceae bacterium]
MDSTARNSLVLIAVVAVGVALHLMSDIFTPLILAIFLMFLIDGLARQVNRWLPWLPGWAVLPTALGVITVAFLASAWLIVNGIAGFSADVVQFGDKINGAIAKLASRFEFDAFTVESWLRDNVKIQSVTSAAPQVLRTAQTAFSGLGYSFFVLVYLGFLIASRDNFRRKIVVLFPEREDRKDAMHVFDRVRSGVEGYIWVQTVTGLMIAGVCWGVMAAVGLHNALFWAFLIFVLSYIPIIGSVIAALAPPLFALVQFDSPWPAVTIFVVTQLVLQVVGNVVLPKMQADDQNIDPIVVLLSLAFWGAIWGVTGAFLSTPLTVMAMAIMAEFKGSRWVAVLLSGDGDPYPDDAPPPSHDPPMPHPAAPAKPRSRAGSRKPPA